MGRGSTVEEQACLSNQSRKFPHLICKQPCPVLSKYDTMVEFAHVGYSCASLPIILKRTATSLSDDSVQCIASMLRGCETITCECTTTIYQRPNVVLPCYGFISSAHFAKDIFRCTSLSKGSEGCHFLILDYIYGSILIFVICFR